MAYRLGEVEIDVDVSSETNPRTETRKQAGEEKVRVVE